MNYNRYEISTSITNNTFTFEIKRNGYTFKKVIDKDFKGVYRQLKEIYDDRMKRKIINNDTEAIRKALELLINRFKGVK